jgi:MoaA/NifB/PqqE/SkfB family radical SAM enzyme
LEIAQIPLSRLQPVGGGRLFRRSDAAVLVTAPGQWQFSAEASPELPGIEREERTLNIRATVDSGTLGVGWLSSDGSSWIAREICPQSSRPVNILLDIPQGLSGGKLVFDNATVSGRPAVATILGIQLLSPSSWTEGRRVARMLASGEKDAAGINPDSDAVLFLERSAHLFTKDEFIALAPNKPILQNFSASIWEFAHGSTELTSYPWNITIPVADLCNARCTFCTSWLDGRKVLDLSQLGRFAPVLRNALFIGLVGHGEPMAHPRFDELCDRLAKMRDPLSKIYTITNGFFLEKWRGHLERINLYSYSISLNAASAETHNVVMGLGPDAFPRIVNSIADLVEFGNTPNRDKVYVYITMVVTQQNIAEIPAFVELGNRLGVAGIWFRSLLPQANLIPGLNYHLLPPYLHPDFERLRRSAVAAIQASEVPVQADPGVWGQKIFSDALEQQIRLKPPPTVSREQALRDRELRQRNEYLYRQEKGIFRGRPLERDSTSDVKWSNGRLTFATPRASGAYAAAVAVTHPGEGEQQFSVEADVACESGIVGLGLLDVTKNEWLDRVFIEPGATQRAVLRTTANGQQIQLVIHNGGGDNIPARGSLGAVAINVEGIGQSLPIEWGTLVVHNAADPLDDGTNPLGRQPRFACKAVYYNLYINEFFYRVNPCCYLQQVPGFEEVRLDGDMTFMDAWNSPGMVELRRRLKDGPLFGACVRCPEKW